MTDARPRDAVKVGFVQMNTAVDSSMYLPYSVALLQAYLQEHSARPERYAFALPIVHRLSPGARRRRSATPTSSASACTSGTGTAASRSRAS